MRANPEIAYESLTLGDLTSSAEGHPFQPPRLTPLRSSFAVGGNFCAVCSVRRPWGDTHTTAAVALAVLVGLGVSACSSNDDSASMSQSTGAFRGGSTGRRECGRIGRRRQPRSQTPAPALVTAIDATGQALATVAGVTVTTPDIRRAVDDTLVAVQRNAASVYTADVNIGDERDDGSVDGSGYFVVKVPPTELEPLIADLGATVGTVSGRTQDTSDVTDQLVDLDIRIGVERDVIERFQLLLTQAAEFQDIVEIERVISERTISLEQLLASQRTLENRVEMSTLTISLQYVAPAAEVAPPAGDTITDAWRTGWDVFVGILFVDRARPRRRGAVPRRRDAGSRRCVVRQPPPTDDAGRTADRPDTDGHRTRRRARCAQPRGVSTRSLTLPSGNTNGARTPVWAVTSGSVSGPKPNPPDSDVQRCQRCAGTSTSSTRRFAEDLDRPVDHTDLFVAGIDRRPVAGGFERRRRRRRVPLEVERDRRRVAVGPTERLIGIVDRRGVGLVADRPLFHLGIAVVLGPQRLALDDERVGTHRHVEVGDVQERRPLRASAAQYQAVAPDDPMTGDQAEPSVGRPRREHPLLDRGAVVATVVPVAASFVRWFVVRRRHDQADYEP